MSNSRGAETVYLLRAVGGAVLQILSDEVNRRPLFIEFCQLRKGEDRL